LKNKGLLKRFSINCYGHQESLEEILEIKSKKFIELKNNKNSPTYKKWFFQYDPTTKNIESNDNNDNEDLNDDKQKNKHKLTSKKQKQKTLKPTNSKNKNSKNKTSKNKNSKNKTSKNPLSKFIKLF
jgi:hypothetical protein